ncbi:Fic family protein [Pseudomonas sp.]|uniref:Fic family protein n=1 Tax=Pseudomonas sp. TaxID=306 RepID=UPI003977DBD9
MGRLSSMFRQEEVLSVGDLMEHLSHRTSFRNNYLNPALLAGCVEMSQPGNPRSPTQGYRLASKRGG